MRTMVFLALMAAAPCALEAQVGHDPLRSPYRDVPGGTFLMASFGQFFGDGGQAAVAPHNGQTYGLHVNLLANKPLQINLGIIYGDLERMLVDPRRSPANRSTGPVPNGVLWVDAAAQFNLTGNKTWHGFAPYTGAATGLAFTETVSEDPGNFKMGTKIVLSPMIGTRYFISKSLHLMVEARFQFWQANYPASYALEPILDPGTPSDPHAVLPNGVLHEWLLTPWVRVGLGFPWPF